MKKVSLIGSLILVSAMSVAAQAGSKGELARLRRSSGKEKTVSARKSVLRAPGVLIVGPSKTYLKKGLSTGEVVRFLGRPATVSERQEGNLQLATYIFQRGKGRVLVAEFENGVLVNSHAEPSQTIAQN